MNKIFAFGVTGLLMLGTASQASASFEAGHFTMSIYNGTITEMGFDLGALDVHTSVANLLTGLDFSTFTSSTRAIGIYTEIGDQPNNIYEGYFATTKATGALTVAATGTADLRPSPTIGAAFNNNEQSVRGYYATLDTDHDGIVSLVPTAASSFKTKMNNTYGGLVGNTSSSAKNPLTGSVNMYLYHFDTANYAQKQATETGYNYIVDGTTYDGVFTLTSDGNLSYTTNLAPVPIPGAVWLLGSGLVGLAGIRRRKNG